MTSFVLKIIAMIIMIIDHSGDVFYPILGNKTLYFNAIGRIAFPLFCFMLVEGYTHTSNLKKYILRLFIASIISQIPFQILIVNIMHSKPFSINVLFTLMFGLFSLYIWDFKLYNKDAICKDESKTHSFTIKDIFVWILKLLLIATLITISTLANFDYGQTGILLILAIYLLFKNHKLLFLIASIGLSIFNYREAIKDAPIWGAVFVITASIIPFILMLLYNGKKGKNTKYGLYAIYPIHLILLELIYYFFIK